MTKLLTPTRAQPIPLSGRARRIRGPGAAITHEPQRPIKKNAPRGAFQTMPPQPPSVREIRDRAYYLYLERNGQGGNAQDDWVTAERQAWAEYRAALAEYYASQRPPAP